MATDIVKCSKCNVLAPLSEPTTDKLSDIEYANYCWHCNECTSMLPFSGIITYLLPIIANVLIYYFTSTIIVLIHILSVLYCIIAI